MSYALGRRRWLHQIGTLALIGSGGAFCFFQDAQSTCKAQQNAIEESQWHLSELAGIESLVEAAIADGEMPGCVISFGSHHQTAWLKAYGDRQIEPTREAMTIDTIFDLASLTKPLVTATSIMSLLDQGKLKLDDPVSKFIPEFAVNGKAEITIEDLLVHRSGLIPDNPLSDYLHGPERAWTQIWQLKPTAPRGTRFQYSDVNFLVLGRLIELISGQSLDRYAKQHIFDPLAMYDTSYNPAADLQARIAPTEKLNDSWLRGRVHDPRAAALGGVAGHAGLFSTAVDLSTYCQAMLRLARPTSCDETSKLPFGRSTLQLMNQPIAIGKEIRGLGWDKASSYSGNGGTARSASAFGHGGFTGTVLWIDPDQDWYFVFLSNRLHPDGRGAVNSLAGQIVTLVAKAKRRSSPAD